jgi:hypothetical protein
MEIRFCPNWRGFHGTTDAVPARNWLSAIGREGLRSELEVYPIDGDAVFMLPDIQSAD